MRISRFDSNHEKFHEFVHWRGFKSGLILAEREDFFRLDDRNTPAQIGLEFFQQDGNAFRATTAMTNGVLDSDTLGGGTVLEENLHGVADGAFGGIEVIGGEGRVFNHGHFGSQDVDTGVGRDGIFVVLGGKGTFQERDGDHVLDAVVAIGGIGQRTGFVDDAFAAFLGLDDDALDGVEAGCDLRVQDDGGFNGGLGVEFGGEGDFEKHVLHNVGGKRLGQGDGFSLEEDILKSP